MAHFACTSVVMSDLHLVDGYDPFAAIVVNEPNFLFDVIALSVVFDPID